MSKFSTILDSNGRKIVRNNGKPHRPNLKAFGGHVNGAGFGYYAGSNPGIQRGETYFAVPQDFNTESIFDREFLAYHAWQLWRNHPEIGGLVERIIEYVVGAGGMMAQSIAKSNREDYDEYWKEWIDVASPDGSSFGDIQEVCLRNMILSGDVGLLKIKTKGMPQLQVIPSHRIGNCPTKTMKNSREAGGVEYDPRNGRVIRYWIQKGRVSKNNVDEYAPVPVRPESFELMFKREGSPQYRGVSVLARVILDAIDIADILEASKLGIRYRESIAGVIKRESGVVEDEDGTANAEEIFGDKPSSDTEIGKAVLPMVDDNFKVMGNLTVPTFRPGESYEDLQNKRPSSDFVNFIETVVRRICVSMKLPYSFIIDPGKIHGTATRLILKDAETTFMGYANLLNRHINRVAWRYVIWDGIIKGYLPLNEDWDAVQFKGPVAPTVDVAKDNKADIESLNAGLSTYSSLWSRHGKDYRDQFRQIANEQRELLDIAKDISKEYGIPLLEARKLLTTGADLDGMTSPSSMENEDTAKIGRNE